MLLLAHLELALRSLAHEDGYLGQYLWLRHLHYFIHRVQDEGVHSSRPERMIYGLLIRVVTQVLLASLYVHSVVVYCYLGLVVLMNRLEKAPRCERVVHIVTGRFHSCRIQLLLNRLHLSSLL